MVEIANRVKSIDLSQIRKMFDEIGYEVVRLHREAIGTIYLHGMVPGETRRLKPHEVKELRTLAMAKKAENAGFEKEKNAYRPRSKKVEEPKKKTYRPKTTSSNPSKDPRKTGEARKYNGSRSNTTSKGPRANASRPTNGNGRRNYNRNKNQ